MIQAALDDWRTAPVSDGMRAMLGFLEKLTQAPQTVSSADVQPLFDAGLSQQAIEEAIYVCFVFNIINRLADAFDFEVPAQRELRNQANFLYKMGYSASVLPV